MTEGQFSEFAILREGFRDYVASLSAGTPWLGDLQERLRVSRGYDDYRIETPVVYNEALDELGPTGSPRFIVVADNPGKSEQKSANRRYLVGQSGKLAQSWFRKELDLDFRASALIINKTPIHTPKTAELGLLRKLAAGDSKRKAAQLDLILEESQRTMARLAFGLHSCLGGVLWISGYGELKPGRLFAAWAEEMTSLYAKAPKSLRDQVWVFRHFSMNQCAIEYKRYDGAALDPVKKLAAIGLANRERILGW